MAQKCILLPDYETFIKPSGQISFFNQISGFQTPTRDLSVFPFLPRHYHMTCVFLLPFISTVWTPVVLAIINIILAMLKMFMMMMMMMMTLTVLNRPLCCSAYQNAVT